MERSPPPTKKKITFVFPLEVIERIRHLAVEHGRSLNGEMVWALRQYLARQDRQSSEQQSGE
jgi:predicted transcriptional regulator